MPASSEISVQTDPILVPFPLPSIGRPKTEVAKMTTSMQTEYCWLFREFPVRETVFCQTESEMVSAATVPVSSPVTKPAEVKKPRSSPQRKPKQPQVTEDTSVSSSEAISAAETQPAVVVALPVTPARKRASPKKPVRIEEPVPETPATSASQETPRLIAQIMSDSEGENEVMVGSLIAGSAKKKSSQIAPIETPRGPPALVADSSSDESDARSGGPSSSSSDSEAGGVPSTATISSKAVSKKRKQLDSPRVGPIVQIDNVVSASIEEIKKSLSTLVPEKTREGALKSAVMEDNKLYVQLRMAPSIVQYFKQGRIVVDKEELKMVVLSDSAKKKVAPLFADISKKSKQ
jgi:hypothetical protein